MYDITDLQRKLQENRDRIETAGRGLPVSETHPPYLMGRYRLRTAARDNANKLLQSGEFSPLMIADFLNIPVSEVEDEKRLMEMKRRYLATGSPELPDGIAHVSILQR